MDNNSGNEIKKCTEKGHVIRTSIDGGNDFEVGILYNINEPDSKYAEWKFCIESPIYGFECLESTGTKILLKFGGEWELRAFIQCLERVVKCARNDGIENVVFYDENNEPVVDDSNDEHSSKDV